MSEVKLDIPNLVDGSNHCVQRLSEEEIEDLATKIVNGKVVTGIISKMLLEKDKDFSPDIIANKDIHDVFAQIRTPYFVGWSQEEIDQVGDVWEEIQYSVGSLEVNGYKLPMFITLNVLHIEDLPKVKTRASSLLSQKDADSVKNGNLFSTGIRNARNSKPN